MFARLKPPIVIAESAIFLSLGIFKDRVYAHKTQSIHDLETEITINNKSGPKREMRNGHREFYRIQVC